MPDFSALGFEGTAPVQLANLAKTQNAAAVLGEQANALQLKNQQAQALQGYVKQAAEGMGVSPESVPGLTGTNDVPRMLENLSLMAMKAGDATAAGNLAIQASKIRSTDATTQDQEFKATKDRAAAQWSQLTQLEQILSVAHDQPSFDHANALYAGVFGQQSPYVGMKYEDVQPQLESLSQQVLTAKDKVQLALQASDTQSKQDNRDSAIDFRNFRKTLMQEAEDRAAGREKRLAKNGGKIVGSPSQTQVDQAYPLVAAAMPDLDPTEKMQKATAVASMARKLMTDHPGLDADTATRQALQKISKIPGVTYQDGSVPSQALPLPADRKLEVGKYYNTTKGVGKFTGSGIELLPSGIEFDKQFNDNTDSTDAGD